MTDDERIAECARQAERPELRDSDAKIAELARQARGPNQMDPEAKIRACYLECRDPNAIEPNLKIQLAAGGYGEPLTKALPDPDAAKLDELAAMLRRPARPAARRRAAPAPLQAAQPPARRQAPPLPPSPPMRTPPRLPMPSRTPTSTRPTGPALVPGRRRTVRVRREDLPFVMPLGGYEMDDYHKYRSHIAYDLRRGIVSSDPAKLVDHVADRAAVDMATASEWVERFLSDVQRHIKHSNRRRAPA